MSDVPAEARLKVGDNVRIVAQTLTWRAEKLLQDKIGVVTDCHQVGYSNIERVNVLFRNGRTLMNRDAANFERVEKD